MAKWLVAKTKGQRETYAAENIERQERRIYLPRQQSFRGRGKLREAVAEPVFRSYVFVDIDSGDGTWRFLLSTYGVVSVIMSGNDPAIMPIAALIKMKKQEENGWFVPPELKRGDLVRINSGSHADCMGIYQGQTSKQRAAILMEILGGKRRVEIDYDALELVA